MQTQNVSIIEHRDKRGLKSKSALVIRKRIKQMNFLKNFTILCFTLVTLHYAANIAQAQAKDENTQEKQTTYYTCVRHDEIEKDKPGKCPTCTLDLIEGTEDRTVKKLEANKEEPEASEKDTDNEEPKKLVGWLEIKGYIRETPSAFLSQNETGKRTLQAILNHLNYVAESDEFSGILIITGPSTLSFSQTYTLDQAFSRIRKSGKKIIFFSESYTTSQYLLACSADKIILQNKGGVQLQGSAIEEMYFADLFKKIGVKADFVQVGQYKGADEAMTRNAPSPQWSQNIDNLLDSSYDLLTSYIGKKRNLTKEQVENIFKKSWAYTDQECKTKKLVDQISPRELKTIGKDHFGQDFTWVDLAKDNLDKMPQDIFSLMKMFTQKPDTSTVGPTIAVINAVGTITSGKSLEESIFGDTTTIGSETFRKTIRTIAKDDNIKALVIYINSPGGSALASEVMWQEIKRVTKKKPVYFAVGRMAASGGYYMASAADKIYVTPTSILGSIGVVSGKVTMGELYKKLGIAVHTRTRGPVGSFFSSVDKFTPLQRKLILASSQNIYNQFTDRVKAGRKNKVKNIEDVAQGRLFTGSQAIKNGLADKLGSLEIAIKDIAKVCKLEEGDYDIINLPRPQSLAEALSQSVGLQLNAKQITLNQNKLSNNMLISSIKQLLGPKTWQNIQPILNGYMLLQKENTILLLPNAVQFK